MRGTRALYRYPSSYCRISIHVPLRGGRHKGQLRRWTVEKFQSTSPYAGDDQYRIWVWTRPQNFNPRPPARGTTASISPLFLRPEISIHVPLRGGRLYDDYHVGNLAKFQSTSPYAGDDRGGCNALRRMAHFNPRPPTRGTTKTIKPIKIIRIISIHVPLRGGRPISSVALKTCFVFQSTSPYAGDDSSETSE